VALIYDDMLIAMALAWLVRAARAEGFLPWEKAAMAAIFIAPLLSRNIGMPTHIPVAIFATLALLGLIVMRVRVEPAVGNGAVSSSRAFTASTKILAK
jgi:hypothetical protein